ncbi:MAG: LemA family protein [Planctomycetota bacterium]
MAVHSLRATRASRGFTIAGFFLLVLSVGLIFGGFALSSCSFNEVRKMRELERVPQTEAAAVVQGEVNIVGLAEPSLAGGTVDAPRTNSSCLYFSYTKEEKRRDSKGKTHWSTVASQTAVVREFTLRDDSGQILVVPIGADITFNVAQKSQTYSADGKYRYTEDRIDPGDRLFIFGYASQEADKPMVVEFRSKGRYTPIISMSNEDSARTSMAVSSLFACWGGLVALSFAIVFACMALGIHRVITYLLLVSLIMGGGLVYYGLNMMNDDLHAARERVDHHVDVVCAECLAAMQHGNVAWSGTDEQALAGLGSLDDAQYAALPDSVRHRLSRIRIDLWRATRRCNELFDQFPESALAPMLGVSRCAEWELPPADREIALGLDRSFRHASLSSTIAWIIVGVGSLIGLMLTIYGFRAVKTKRYIENMPTTPVAGATWGPLEVVGTVALPTSPPKPGLRGPLSGVDCVQYHYVVQEQRGSGKNTSWVTIENRNRHMHFLCTQPDGQLRVNPAGAEIFTKHRVSRHSGNRTYSETSIRPGDQLYALGHAAAVPPDFKELELGKAPDRFPFILANKSEMDILLGMSRRGLMLMNIALCAVVLVGLAAFGARGGFTASDYLLAALIAPAYLAFLFLLLLYNDIVFLRQRVGTTMSNIDIALKKRFDLLPNLEAVAKQYLAHERDLQTRLAGLRTQNMHDAGGVVTSGFTAVIERYPALKGNEQTAKLMKSLIRLENEIALMRESYNQAVERYNSRIGQFPELFIALLCRFRAADFYKADFEVHEVPSLGFEEAPVVEDDGRKDDVVVGDVSEPPPPPPPPAPPAS